MVDTLWQYEKGKCSGIGNVLRQNRRKIEYLASQLEGDAIGDITSDGVPAVSLNGPSARNITQT
jgi:hypothetical protein